MSAPLWGKAWLDALLILKPAIGGAAVCVVYSRTVISMSSKRHFAYTATRIDSQVQLWLSESIFELPPVELMEILVSAVCVCHSRLTHTDITRLAERLGVYPNGTVSDPIARWHKATFESASFPDTRPICAVCSLRMTSAETHPRVHAACITYARNKLKPIQRPVVDNTVVPALKPLHSPLDLD